MTRLLTPAPDAVSAALRSLSVRSTLLCISELRAPWAFSVRGDATAKFHVVLEGSALLVGPGGEPTALAAGDLAVLPRGAGHTLAADAATPARPLEQILAERPLDGGIRLRHGGVGARTTILCGGFALAEGTPAAALSLLPEVVLVRRENGGAAAALEPLLTALTAEAAEGRPGANAVVAKLADVLLASALRSWFTRDGAAPPGVVNDAAVAQAVLALTTAVAEPWSLDRLARRVGLSRTALATRFRRATGMAPMQYLALVRLDRAAEHLAAGVLTTQEIAHRTGYANDASLSKAFRRRYGLPPGAYRAAAGLPPAVETDERVSA